MKRAICARLCIALMLDWALPFPLGAQPESPDWRFYSFSGPVNATNKLLVFYSQAELKRLASGHIEVWSKALNPDEVNRIFNNINKYKAILDRAAKKLSDDDYQPSYAGIHSLTDDDRTTITGWEEIANEDIVSTKLRILLEVDCTQRMLRQLSAWGMEDGKIQSSDKAGEWQHIAPETSAATLEKLVCPPNQERSDDSGETPGSLPPRG